METLTIKRSKWLRGEANSGLLRAYDNKMCCLGFLGLSCGFDEGELEDRDLPSSINTDRFMTDGFWPNILFNRISHWGYAQTWEYVFASINDELGSYDEERETWLKVGFKEVLGIDLTFED